MVAMTRSPKRRGGGVRRARPSAGSATRTWFVFGVATLALSTGILAAVLLGQATSGNGVSPAPTDDGSAVMATATPTNSVPGPTRTSLPPSPEATATRAATLPCGDVLVPLGKARSLAPDCVPADLVTLPERMTYLVDLPILLRREAAAAMVEMLDAARAQGLVIVVRSAYRSYDDQVRTFNYWVSVLGEQEAERSSARPGHSEHQLGTTGDLTSASNGFELEGFEGTAEGRWIAANAPRYGFVISFPEGKEDITGYVFEPWHVRYLGKGVASQVQASGLTPIEFLERR